ncbi:MAG: YciC family protein, partial [Croceibacterium sp.]
AADAAMASLVKATPHATAECDTQVSGQQGSVGSGLPWQLGRGKMATVLESGDSVSVGRVFSRGFGVIASNPATVFGIAFLFGGLPSLVLNLIQRRMTAGTLDSYQMIGSVGLAFASALVALVLQALVQGSLVRATLAYARGERATFGECIRSGLAVILPLIGLALLMGLGIGIGFVFFLVPGFMLLVMWSVASPAMVAERPGVFGALRRSRYLTKGARWKVFGVEALILLAYYVFMLAFGAATLSVSGTDLSTAVTTTGLSLSWVILTVISSTIVNTVWSTVQTSLYVELRNWKEGLPEQTLEEIFA